MGPPGLGMVILGMPNVLIGGFPMINTPNPIEALLNLLGHFKPRHATDEYGEPGKAGPLDE